VLLFVTGQTRVKSPDPNYLLLKGQLFLPEFRAFNTREVSIKGIGSDYVIVHMAMLLSS
jgi:hypothetical protein